jgi:hypothetical protein
MFATTPTMRRIIPSMIPNTTILLACMLYIRIQIFVLGGALDAISSMLIGMICAKGLMEVVNV